ncbi:hypothetical protein CPB84DRAFT_786530 [Gymnopilus junonius]|uniref:Uncharacterized protein n=1 Tax=Gymnopilus junonius TaxID=109634 RepID=A0A9P5NTL2_GYMJU|nr:hypothetical protein CPB84DRAFT_786530 [Gymnopilus junonius]
MKPEEFSSFSFERIVWTLIDSASIGEVIPPNLIEQGTRLFVILATPPNKQRWKGSRRRPGSRSPHESVVAKGNALFDIYNKS